MSERRPGINLLIWGMLGAAIVAVVVAFAVSLFQEQSQPLPVYGKVGSFTLTNQLGEAVSLETLRGHPWVADAIFTRCAGPCLKMTRQMMRIQEGLPTDSEAKLLSVTVDPEYDTPKVLDRYAERFNAEAAQWQFLTGSRKKVYEFILDGLRLAAEEQEEVQDPGEAFIHSTRLVLVDRKGQIRAYFKGTDPQAPQQVLQALARLQNERTQ